MASRLSDEARAGLERCLPFLAALAGRICRKTRRPWGDVLSDVYAIAVQMAGHWRPDRGGSMLTYLYPYVACAYADRRRQDLARRRRTPTLSLDRLRQDAQCGPHSPWEEPPADGPERIDAADLRAALEAAKSAVGADDWQILWEWAGGSSLRECGERRGVSRSRTQQRYRRAIGLAREAIRARYPELTRED